MKRKLGILSAMVLSLAIAGSAFAANVTQDTMTAKPTATKKMTHKKHRTAKKRKSTSKMKSSAMTTKTPTK